MPQFACPFNFTTFYSILMMSTTTQQTALVDGHLYNLLVVMYQENKIICLGYFVREVIYGADVEE